MDKAVFFVLYKSAKNIRLIVKQKRQWCEFANMKVNSFDTSPNAKGDR